MTSQSHTRSCETLEVFTALERVNSAIVEAKTSEEMLAAVLEEMLEIFDCDRAWLLLPHPPGSETFEVPMERTRPEWPGAGIWTVPVPIDAYSREIIDLCLGSDDPIRREPDENPLDTAHEAIARFQIQSQLMMAIRPKADRPWILGIHHCAEARNYGAAIGLFRAIGGRVADALTTLLANRALRQSEERFRTLVEHAPEAIVILDCATGQFVDANPKAVRLFGLERHELLDSIGPVDLSPETQPDGRSSSEAAMAHIQAALGGDIPVFEWTHLHSNGQPIPCELRLARLPHSTRQLLRGSITDISARKRAEQERADLEARLAQAQKMEAIGQLTGGIAHDFNNLLTVILGNLELVPDFVHDRGALLQLVEHARSATERACKLTHRLLAFSRRQPLRPQALDVRDLMQEMDHLLRRTLGEEIEVALALDPDVWTCEADATQLEQAILNLAINARDAMPEGGLLTIEAGNVYLDEEYAARNDDVVPGPYACLAVSDNGSGIEPDILPDIFAPFFTTKGVGKGSGLGLSMVYGFVKQSHGHVKAYSEVGVGTTMKLYLPRATSETPPFERAPAPDELNQGTGERILIVEDEEGVRSLTRILLTQLGYEVLEAANGEAALELLQEHPEVDLLLTDVVLPAGLNGPELARRARQRLPGLRVLFMSGYTENAIIHNGRLDADVILLEKPFTKRALAMHVRQALDEAAR